MGLSHPPGGGGRHRLGALAPADEDDRRLLILAEHQSCRRPSIETWTRVGIGGKPVSPRLHLSMHKIVANPLG